MKNRQESPSTLGNKEEHERRRSSFRKTGLILGLSSLLTLAPDIVKSQNRQASPEKLKNLLQNPKERQTILYQVTARHVDLSDPESIRKALEIVEENITRAKAFLVKDSTSNSAASISQALKERMVIKTFLEEQLKKLKEKPSLEGSGLKRVEMTVETLKKVFTTPDTSMNENQQKQFNIDLNNFFNDAQVRLMNTYLREYLAHGGREVVRFSPDAGLRLLQFVGKDTLNLNSVVANDSSDQAFHELRVIKNKLEKQIEPPSDTEFSRVPSGTFFPFRTKAGTVWIKKNKDTRLELATFVLEHTFFGTIERVRFNQLNAHKDLKNFIEEKQKEVKQREKRQKGEEEEVLKILKERQDRRRKLKKYYELRNSVIP